MFETSARIEPCSFGDDIPRVLADLASEIQRESALLGRDLHPDAAAELTDFVRVMNCYYSNLIEGHDTRPRDIERALAGAELDDERRPLALEARAHVLVQRMIDEAFTASSLPSPTSIGFVTWVHRQFYENMPPEFRAARGKDGQMLPIEPGSFRSKSEEDVAVGRHVPPSSDRVTDFMGYFEQRFRAEHAGASTRILAIAVAHHRLNYIHPFLDGNGRVSRLMSHAMGLKAGIGGEGLWSISRGLARGLKERGEYKQMMDHADSPRHGDLDGRGNLSRAALKDYCEWFLAVMLDQIRFTRAVFKLETLDNRYRKLLTDLGHDKRASDMVSAILKFGQIDRGDASIVLTTSERTARNVVSKLVDGGFLKSSTPKGPLRIAFPLDHRDRLFPSLFADAAIDAPEPPRIRSSN
jgi:Fic family protein